MEREGMINKELKYNGVYIAYTCKIETNQLAKHCNKKYRED